MPFADAVAMNLHFQKHRNEFNFASEIEYQNEADKFMAGTVQPPTRECYRTSGDRVRYDRNSGYFAVAASNGNLKTFHKPSERYREQCFFKFECEIQR